MNVNEPPASPLARLVLRLACALLPPVRRLQQRHAALRNELARIQARHERLVHETRLYEPLFEQTYDAVAIFTLDGTCIRVNTRMAEMLGYEPAELLGMNYGHVANNQTGAAAQFERIINGEQLPTYERTLVRKDGTIVEAEVSSALVRDERGQPLHVQAIHRDVNERRKAQAKMADQNRLLHTIIDTIPDFIYVKDREGRLILDNAAHASSLSRLHTEIYGKTDLELFPLELAERFVADEQPILTDGESLINHEEPSLGPDGEPMWALTSKVPLRDSAGEIVGLVGVTRDITELKQREKQLAESERFIQQVTATIPDIVYVYDYDKRDYRYFNYQVSHRLLGYADGEYHYNDPAFLSSTFHPEDQHIFRSWRDRFTRLSDGEIMETRYRARHKDGTWRLIYCRDQVFERDADGVPVVSLGIVQDLTERETSEQQLRRQNEYLRALSQVTLAIVNRFDPNDILSTVLRRTKTLMQTEDVYLEMLESPADKMPDTLHIRRFGGDDYAIELGKGVVGRVCETGETVVVEDYGNWPYRIDASKLSSVRASIGVPLKSGERIVGVLGVSYTDGERSFESAEIDILNRIGELAAIALDNAQLFAAAQHELAERVRIEVALRASEERYRAVIETQTDLVARFLPDMTLTFVNNAYCRFFKLSPGALVGRSFEMLVAPQDRASLREHIAGLTRLQPAQTAEFLFVRQNGVMRWLQCSNRAIFGMNGRVIEYQMVARDVTEQRQAEEALRISEARYRAVVESQTEMICRFAPDNTVTFVNDAYCRYYGDSPDEVLGRTLPLRMPLEDWLRIEPQIQAQLRGELEVAEYEHRTHTPSGELRWQQWIDRVVHDEHGNVIELQAVGRDITEQKQAQMALNAERDYVAAIVDNTVTLLAVVDREGHLVTYNRACEALSGVKFKEIAGMRLWDAPLIPDDEIEQVKQVFDHVIAGDFPNRNFNHWQTRDGGRRLIEWSNMALVDEHGEVTHIVSSGVDITARQQLEERNLELALEREKVKLLGNFIRDASHDFRTPLSILNTNLYLLRRMSNDDAFDPRLTEMEQQIVHLTRLIDQLLTMSRLDSGADVKLIALSLNELIENVCASLYTSVRDKQLTLEMRLAEDLPPLTGDAWQLNEALRNVIANAVQFTPNGGTITIETEACDGQVVIRVSDTGIGIAADDLPFIFERFFRADRARAGGEAGTGLGLAITRKIVDLHEGTISVASTPGEQTVFSIALPADKTAPEAIVAD